MSDMTSIPRAARELGISEETLRKKIAGGEIPSYKLGPKATRVDLEEIKKITRTSKERRER